MIALVFCGDLKYCPYIRRYIERLEFAGVAYKVYFWNRGGYDLSLPSNYKYYEMPSKLNKKKYKKMIDFIQFRKWLKKELKCDKPDRIVALSTLTGVILGSSLYKNSNNYIFDIRDYSYEHIAPFKRIEEKLIQNSAFTAISSKGFMEFLPKHNYIVAHNFNRQDIVEGATFQKASGKIRFVWNGVMRYFEFQKRYLNALKNDERFEIVFHGDGPEFQQYVDYCKENSFNNVVFTGSYDNSHKAMLLSGAGILNNCYGHVSGNENAVRYAVSNRFYDGLIFHIPQLVEPEGFKPEWTKKAQVGISLNVDENFADNLYNYYQQIDADVFDYSCKKTLEEVINEDDEYIARIDQFICGR